MGFLTGRKSGIGSTPLQITTSSIRADKGVQIYSPATNTADIYVGNSGLTRDSGDATDGFPLSPGDSILFPHRIPSEIYVSTSGSSQKVFFLIQ